jgi:hypothetical protein
MTPLKPGSETTEWKGTKIAMYGGLILEAAVLPALAMFQSAHPGAAWAAGAMGLSGALLQAFSLFGYQRARSSLKATAMTQGVPGPV